MVFLNAKGRLAGHQLHSIDPGGTIGQAISVTRVVGCVVHTAASVDEPGIIRHRSGRQLLVVEPDNRLTARLARLADWLCRAGFDCRESTNIQGDIWFKLWGNLSMNPISLLTSATSDRILDDPLVRRLCVSMMEEAARIGAEPPVVGTLHPSSEACYAALASDPRLAARNLARPRTLSMNGVGTPMSRPMSCVTVSSASISTGLPCSRSCI